MPKKLKAARASAIKNRPEIILALVGAVGADLDQVVEELSEALQCYRYDAVPVHLSRLFSQIDPKASKIKIPAEPGFDRQQKLMDLGNWMRKTSGQPGILANWAAATIASNRTKNSPTPNKAYIIRSLKHPAEVRVLREIYGAGFFLVAVHASEPTRQQNLQRGLGITLEEARSLIARDEGEPNSFGQQTRDAFSMADVFLAHDRGQRESIDRFLRLVFGDPLLTPHQDEHAMFMAYASSLRSADLSRQVGAVVWNPVVGMIATGANDVPQSGGGPYWPGATDRRDHNFGHDANVRHRQLISQGVAANVAKALKIKEKDKIKKIADACEHTRVFDLTEFGRAVHAEMNALLTCARAGVSTQGSHLYSTTFPCHNCTKHIVDAGIARVIYIEPYPKSQAVDLHGDAIVLDDDGGSSTKTSRVVFRAFEGIGPRRYFDLFSMRLGDGREIARKNKSDGRVTAWSPGEAHPRVPLPATDYLERELSSARVMKNFVEAKKA